MQGPGSSLARCRRCRRRRQPYAHIRDDTRRADGVFAKGTGGCDGMGECQFITLQEAQTFCENHVACVAVLKHPGWGNCAGSKGCYTPRSGELKSDNGHAGTWIKSCSVPPMPTPAVCTYTRDDTRRADGAFAKGTGGCDGMGECQFITLLEAQTFCENHVACVAVLKHPGWGNCAGSKGCYTPRSGELKSDNGHAGTWI